MGRHNIKKNKRRTAADRFDTDYIELPEYPDIARVIAVPMKTIYINIAADMGAMEIYTAWNWCDRVLQDIVSRA